MKNLEFLWGMRAGSVAPTFAFVMVPLIGLAGGTIDYVSMSAGRTTLQNAIDAGTMAAAVSRGAGASVADAERQGADVFTRNCTELRYCAGVTPSVKVGSSDVQGTVSGSAPTLFLPVIGIESFEVAAASQVKIGVNAGYEDFYYLIDMSDSISIAADEANKTKLRAVTKPVTTGVPEGCEFACHTVYSGFGPKSLYEIARENKVRLREDVLIEAVNASLDQILSSVSGTHADRYRVGAWGFSDDIEELSKLTSNSTNVKTKVQKAAITRYNTKYDVVMPKFTKIVGTGYDGSNKDTPRKTAVIVTDGVKANYDTNAYGPFDPKMCDELKKANVRVVVINVEYQNATGETYFDARVKPYYTELPGRLKTCASPGFSYTADDPTEIQVTFQKMAKDVVQGSPFFAK